MLKKYWCHSNNIITSVPHLRPQERRSLQFEEVAVTQCDRKTVLPTNIKNNMIDISDKDFKILEKITASQRKSRKKI